MNLLDKLLAVVPSIAAKIEAGDVELLNALNSIKQDALAVQADVPEVVKWTDAHEAALQSAAAIALPPASPVPESSAAENSAPADVIKTALILFAFLLFGFSASAQTNAPNEVTKTIAAVSPTGAAVVSDAYNFFAANADLYTNNVIAFEAFGLHSSGTQKYGGGFDVQIPLSNFQPDGSNPSAVLSQSFIGFSLYGFGGNFYDGTANFGIGNNFNVPVVGEVYGFFEAGPGRNLSTGQTIGTAFAGVKYPIPLYKVWPSTKNIVWTIGYAHGDITDQSGQIDAIGTEVVMPLEPIQNFVIGLLQKIKL